MKFDKYLNESSLKVWLDDERKAPNGWIHFKTVPELILFYEKHTEDITDMSLDHDLGENTPTGYDFVAWLEEKIYHKKFINLPKMKVHSANPVGKRRMIQAIKSMEKMVK